MWLGLLYYTLGKPIHLVCDKPKVYLFSRYFSTHRHIRIYREDVCDWDRLEVGHICKRRGSLDAQDSDIVRGVWHALVQMAPTRVRV